MTGEEDGLPCERELLWTLCEVAMDLTTARLVLREFRMEDSDAVHMYASDPEVVTYTDYGPNRLDETVGFVTDAMQSARESPRTRFALAITRPGEDRVLGAVELAVTSGGHRRGVMGYVLVRREWGHGYATEAAGAMLGFAFGMVGLHKVSGTCDPENEASARVLAKIGMRAEGRLRDHVWVRQQWRDRLLFAVVEPTE